MKTLIGMTDFVLKQYEQCISSTGRTYNYAKFLSQKLELWMFVPCDEDGNVFEECSVKYALSSGVWIFDHYDIENQTVESFTDEPLTLTKTALKQIGI